MKHKSLIFIISIYILFCAFSSGIFAEQNKESFSHTCDKIESLLKTLESSKVYRPNDNIEVFKKVLIGEWEGPPRGHFKFCSNGTFEAKNVEGEKIRGVWEMDANFIVLYDNKKGLLGRKEINYYKLSKYVPRRKKEVRYELIIMFDNQDLKTLLNMADALIMQCDIKK